MNKIPVPINKGDQNQNEYRKAVERLSDGMDEILEFWEHDVTKLTDYKKKIFLLMSSMYLVGIKFPNKYGFLSLSKEGLGEYTSKERLKEVEDNLFASITDLEYSGKMNNPDRIFKYFVYIKDVVLHYPKLYMRILDEVEMTINDENDPSGLHELPEHKKDLISISRIDVEYTSNDNRDDHEKFIKRYKKLIGSKVKGK